jgi:hypothetical protein
MDLDRNRTAPRQDGKKHGFRRLSGLEIGLASTVTLALAAGLVAWISHGVSAPAAAATTTVTGNLGLFDFETRRDGCVTGTTFQDLRDWWRGWSLTPRG